MPASTYHFYVDQGEPFDTPLVFKTKQTDGSKVVRNLTEYTARMQVRTIAGAVILDLTTENGKIVITPLTGVLTFNVSASDMSALAIGSHRYDLEIVSGGVPERVIKGNFVVSGEETR